MTRSAFAPALAVLLCAATASIAFAQAKPTTAPTPAAPAAKAKWIPPVKGIATIEVIRGDPKTVGKEVHTVLKIRNTSQGAIALLRADEYWYDKDRKQATGDTQRWTKPFNPGETIEITMKSPIKPNLVQSQIIFAHANGTVKAKGVQKFK